MILKKEVAESDDIKMIRRMFQKSKLMFLQEEKKRIQDMYRILDPGLLLPLACNFYAILLVHLC